MAKDVCARQKLSEPTSCKLLQGVETEQALEAAKPMGKALQGVQAQSDV